jgi:hypothetical protein
MSLLSDMPAGTVDYGGFMKIGAGGVAGQYGAAGTFAQLLSANGANQPESLLMPQSQTTTFRTGLGAGFVAPIITATLNNVPPNAPVATIQMVAWDNSSGNYPTWVEALPAWRSGLIAAGKAPPVNVTDLGGEVYPYNQPAVLIGLQSFNLFFGTPPTVVSQPSDQTAETGSTVTWSARASGNPPLGYQWFLNGTNVPGNPANNNLTLTNIQFSQSGICTVVATNFFGAVTSSPARLNVIAAVERRPVPGVKVTGEAGSLLNVDYADSLSPAPNWTTLGSVRLTSTSQYCYDVTLPLPPQRFYRAWQTDTPSVLPSLSLPAMVPAITLTGSLGDSVRLDYINQFGPIDAWVTLAMVTLTNTSQLYFDVSAPGQPQRLYRIVPSP